MSKSIVSNLFDLQVASFFATVGDFTFWISPWLRPRTETGH